MVWGVDYTAGKEQVRIRRDLHKYLLMVGHLQSRLQLHQNITYLNKTLG